MLAAIFDDVDAPINVSSHDDASLTDKGRLEISGRRHFRLETYVAPVTSVEEDIQLSVVQLRIGVHLDGNSMEFIEPLDHFVSGCHHESVSLAATRDYARPINRHRKARVNPTDVKR
jgi:hypothetical protein